jgi:hypothetical protein
MRNRILVWARTAWRSPVHGEFENPAKTGTLFLLGY